MRYTKEQLGKLIDDGVPMLVITASEPDALFWIRLLKHIHVSVSDLEEAADMRNLEKQFLAHLEKPDNYSDSTGKLMREIYRIQNELKSAKEALRNDTNTPTSPDA